MKISFFSVIKSIIYILSLYIVIIAISFVLVSLTQFNHRHDNIEYIALEIYKKDDIESFKAYKLDGLNICIQTKKAQSNEYLLDYAYYYHFKFETSVNLEVNNINTIKYVRINEEGISSIV